MDKSALTHFADLHDLGYLPLSIKALPEGSLVNPGIPVFTTIAFVRPFVISEPEKSMFSLSPIGAYSSSTTASGSFSTGMLSPVSIDSSVFNALQALYSYIKKCRLNSK